MFDEIFTKRLGNFEFYINCYGVGNKRKLGISFEREEVHCYSCGNDGSRHSLNIYFWKHTFHLDYSKCVCTKCVEKEML